jgi:hypothetical protein
LAVHKRIQQGIRALLASFTPLEIELARRWLSPAELQLFLNMGRSEQLHSLNVLRDVLVQAADTPHDLAVAALLHDAGKGRYRLAVWQKTFSVLLRRLHPRLEQRLRAEDRLTFWRAPFVVRYHHPRWSAQMLREAGSSDRVVWLAEHHADNPQRWRDHPDYPLLLRLIAADDLN